LPDFVALRPRPDAYAVSHPGATDALILVEVSLGHDRKTKLPVYARFGLEVWIVDLSRSAVEVYRNPTEDRYASSSRMTQGVLTPARIPEVTIDIATLLA
jgi:Uma2 family endonuclease